jgi:hypothetical protein
VESCQKFFFRDPSGDIVGVLGLEPGCFAVGKHHLLRMALFLRQGGMLISFFANENCICSHMKSTSFTKAWCVPTKHFGSDCTNLWYDAVGREITKCALISGSMSNTQVTAGSANAPRCLPRAAGTALPGVYLS